MDRILSLRNINNIVVKDSGCFLNEKTVKNSDIIKCLIGAVQEQQIQIDNLTKQAAKWQN